MQYEYDPEFLAARTPGEKEIASEVLGILQEGVQEALDNGRAKMLTPNDFAMLYTALTLLGMDAQAQGRHKDAASLGGLCVVVERHLAGMYANKCLESQNN